MRARLRSAVLWSYVGLTLIVLPSCGSKSPSSPSPTPTPTTTPTRVISLGGNMAFGNIQVGQSFSATLNVRNDGNSPLTISGLSGSTSFISTLTTQGANFTLPAGTSHDVLVTFRPTAAQSYSGTLTVNADHTSGTNTIGFSGTGTLDGLPLFSRSGTGNTVFDMPTYVSRVRIKGVWNGTGTSNFIVRVGGSLEVNEILRDMPNRTYEGTHIVSGGVTEITNSSTVAWTFTEVR